MSLSPLISIIIPAYNVDRFIAETLDSILAQTYETWEAIVVDDHSTDNTAQIIQNYAQQDPRIQYHLAPKHGGNAAIGRNYGLQFAQGDYITFFDSDDIYYPDGLKTLLTPLLEQPNLNATMAFPYYHDIALSPLHPSKHLVEKPDGTFDLSPEYHLDWEVICTHKITLSACCVMLRRSVQLQIEPMDETLSCGEDFKYIVNLLLHGWEKVAVLPKCTFKYRQYKGSVTKDADFIMRSISSHIIATQWLFSLPELPKPYKRLEQSHIYKRLSNMVAVLTKLNRPELARKVIGESICYPGFSVRTWVPYFYKEIIRIILPFNFQKLIKQFPRANKVDYYKA